MHLRRHVEGRGLVADFAQQHPSECRRSLLPAPVEPAAPPTGVARYRHSTTREDRPCDKLRSIRPVQCHLQSPSVDGSLRRIVQIVVHTVPRRIVCTD